MHKVIAPFARHGLAVSALAAALFSAGASAQGMAIESDPAGLEVLSLEMQMQKDAQDPNEPAIPKLAFTPCVDGMAATFPCKNVDLVATVPKANFSAGATSSLWGWTDPQTQIEYALICADNGLVIYSLEDPTNPFYVGKVPTATGTAIWRDVRVYNNHAYIVADGNGAHGLQVFDLTRVRGVTLAQTFTPDSRLTDIGKGHTIWTTEETGTLTVVGSNTCPSARDVGGTPEAGSMRIYSLADPANPLFKSCVPIGGYTHETDCSVYHGPDTEHEGKEICLNANGRSLKLGIVDITDKTAPVTLSSTTYAGAVYPHQAVFSKDFRYVMLNDELDEDATTPYARTWVFDVSNLDAPVLAGYHDSALTVIDHNHYVHGDYLLQSMYQGGFRIQKLGNLAQAEMREVGFFDLYPSGDSAQFNGNWNNFLFKRSGLVIASSMGTGFFVLKPNLCDASSPCTLTDLIFRDMFQL